MDEQIDRLIAVFAARSRGMSASHREFSARSIRNTARRSGLDQIANAPDVLAALEPVMDRARHGYVVRYLSRGAIYLEPERSQRHTARNVRPG